MSTNPDLNAAQKAAAKLLLAKRPMTLPGTRAIIEAHRAAEWHREVAAVAIEQNVTPDQFTPFMDACGVAD